jgi:hypothetical protein
LLPESNEWIPATEDEETSSEESSNDSEDMKTYVRSPKYQNYATSSSANTKRRSKTSTQRRHRPNYGNYY